MGGIVPPAWPALAPSFSRSPCHVVLEPNCVGLLHQVGYQVSPPPHVLALWLAQIWDLTAGKMITDINQHTHPITGLEFHPNEFLLGSSSMDRSIKFWDLETFDLVDTAGPDALPARAIHFTPDGSHLLAAQQVGAILPYEPPLLLYDFMCQVRYRWLLIEPQNACAQDGLRVYSWEPAQQHDWVDAAWTKVAPSPWRCSCPCCPAKCGHLSGALHGQVADMSLHEGKLIGCSFHQTFVGVWVVDLTRVKPFAAGVGAGAGTRTSRSSLSSGRSGEDASAAPAPAASRDKVCAKAAMQLVEPPAAASIVRPVPTRPELSCLRDATRMPLELIR